MNLITYLERHKEWSEHTFGTEPRTVGLLKHLVRETVEIAEDPADVQEWVDAIILSFDALLNLGRSPEQVCALLCAKQSLNTQREWPKPTDGEPTEHLEKDLTSP